MIFAKSTLSVLAELAAWIADHKLPGPTVIGVSGAQGAGKSTLTAHLATLLKEDFGLKVACLSLDDLYLTRAERGRLARTVHPLLATRGVPGTHDVALGIELLEALKSGREVALPVFDKASDDRKPKSDWKLFQGPTDVILFEGWCVGARPQPEAALAEPASDLERTEDPDGSWRRYVNAQLQGSYRELFALLDRLVMLKVPDMACIFRWRLEQEKQLARQNRSGHPLRIMDEAALERFIQHYRRLTLWMLEEMPHRADVLLTLGEDHQIHAIEYR